ncbi:pyridine nucleotide transhydrogenase [Alteromonas sp. CYL-A6]|uniref:pyridine nucleotide transhydrogenase n=1 Tax=Alteromonas nitratireducens TaxID=3390813 RepID=UPI0034B93B14
MRKVVLGLAMLTSFGIAHAESGSNQLFDCMDASSFEMNDECMADKISANVHYRNAQDKILNVASDSQGDYAIATLTFDPKRMQIDIVAHKDALNAMNRLAALRDK